MAVAASRGDPARRCAAPAARALAHHPDSGLPGRCGSSARHACGLALRAPRPASRLLLAGELDDRPRDRPVEEHLSGRVSPHLRRAAQAHCHRRADRSRRVLRHELRADAPWCPRLRPEALAPLLHPGSGGTQHRSDDRISDKPLGQHLRRRHEDLERAAARRSDAAPRPRGQRDDPAAQRPGDGDRRPADTRPDSRPDRAGAPRPAQAGAAGRAGAGPRVLPAVRPARGLREALTAARARLERRERESRRPHSVDTGDPERSAARRPGGQRAALRPAPAPEVAA